MEYSSHQERNYNLANEPYEGPTFQQPAMIQQPHSTVPVVSDQNAVHNKAVHMHHSEEDKIPIVSKTLAVIILFMNIFLPGWGTVLLGFISEHHTTYFVLIGLLQFILTSIIVGWIWAIITAAKVWSKAFSQNESY